MKRKSILVIVTVLMMVLLIACGTASSEKVEETTEETQSEDWRDDVPDGMNEKTYQNGWIVWDFMTLYQNGECEADVAKSLFTDLADELYELELDDETESDANTLVWGMIEGASMNIDSWSDEELQGMIDALKKKLEIKD